MKIEQKMAQQQQTEELQKLAALVAQGMKNETPNLVEITPPKEVLSDFSTMFAQFKDSNSEKLFHVPNFETSLKNAMAPKTVRLTPEDYGLMSDSKNQIPIKKVAPALVLRDEPILVHEDEYNVQRYLNESQREIDGKGVVPKRSYCRPVTSAELREIRPTTRLPPTLRYRMLPPPRSWNIPVKPVTIPNKANDPPGTEYFPNGVKKWKYVSPAERRRLGLIRMVSDRDESANSIPTHGPSMTTSTMYAAYDPAIGKVLGDMGKPKFSGKAEDWQKFKMGWERHVAILTESSPSKNLPDLILLEALKGSLDPHTQKLLEKGQEDDIYLTYEQFWHDLETEFETDLTSKHRAAWKAVKLSDPENLTLKNWKTFFLDFQVRKNRVEDWTEVEEYAMIMQNLSSSWRKKID